MGFSLLHPIILLISLTVIATKALPDCVRPPPPSVPTIEDCEATLSRIMAIARPQGNAPRTWSRNPRHISGQRLPVLFSAGTNNNCEIVVDVANPRDEDVFLTSKVAEVGQEIVNTCLLGSSRAQDTVGVETVGPKGVVAVVLRYKAMLAQSSGNLTDAFQAYTGVAPEASA